MKDFIEHIQKSIYSPSYYREILTRPASHSWKYYGSLAMFLSVVMTIITSLPLVPRLNTFLAQLPEKVIAHYPHDLRVDIAKGIVSTTVSEPYFVNFNGATSTLASTSSLGLVVIDTKSEVNIERFRAYNSIFWLSSNAVVALDKDDSLRTVVLSEMTGTIDRVHVRLWLSEVTPYFVFLPPIFVLLIFLGLMVTFLAMLGYLLLDALLVFLLGKLLKQNWSYKDAYRLSLHAVTLPVLLSSVFYLLPISGFQLPFFSTALVLFVVYINFKDTTPVVTEKNKEG